MDFPDYDVDGTLKNEDNDDDDDDTEDSSLEDYNEEEEISDYQEPQQQQTFNIERYACDTCEREFQTYWQHQKHMSEHKTCNIDGCTFTAHEKIIAKHVQMQHYSGLYEKIKNLETPEDIAKWIADRKKRYPSKENVEKRYKQQDEMLKRGETLKKNPSRFDKRNKTRFALDKPHHKGSDQQHKKKPTRRKFLQKKETTTVSLINDKSDWNGNLFPFKGTNQLYNEEIIDDHDIIDDDDDEWMSHHNDKNTIPKMNSNIKSNKQAQNDSKSQPTNKNALGALMSAYNYSDDSEDEEVNKIDTCLTDTKASIEENISSEDEAPTEEKIDRLEVPFLKEEEQVKVTNETQEQTSNESAGHKRKKSRRRGPNNDSKRRKSTNDKTPNDTSNIVQRASTSTASNNLYRRRRVTLLERLLANEIVHERNVLLQCIRYIVENEFFDKGN